MASLTNQTPGNCRATINNLLIIFSINWLIWVSENKDFLGFFWKMNYNNQLIITKVVHWPIVAPLSSPLPSFYQRHQQLHCVIGQLGLWAPHRQVIDHLLQEISHNPLGALCVCTERCAQGHADLRKDKIKIWDRCYYLTHVCCSESWSVCENTGFKYRPRQRWDLGRQ